MCHYVDAVFACFCILLQNAQPYGKTSMSDQRLDTGCDFPCGMFLHTPDKMMVYLVVQVGVAFRVLRPYQFCVMISMQCFFAASLLRHLAMVVANVRLDSWSKASTVSPSLKPSIT